MDSLSLNGSNDDSLLDGLNRKKTEELLEKTDDTLVKKRKNEARQHGNTDSLINKARVKGELAQYADPMTFAEKVRVVERFAADWEPYFNHKLYKDDVTPDMVDDVPRHPWMTLKDAREEEGGLNSLSNDRRYALRVVKEFYAEKWRKL